MNFQPITRLAWRFLALCLLLFPSGAHAAPGEVRIGVPDQRGQGQSNAEWQEIADYLSRTIPERHFSITPTDFGNSERLMAAGRLEFALVNPSLFVKLAIQYGAKQLATVVKKTANAETAQLGAVIFTRADRTDIASLADLKGRSFMATHASAFAGWQILEYELKENGIDPADLNPLKFSGYPVDKVVDAVLKGEVDAGAVRTDILEQMAAEGKISLAEIRVINRQNTPGFPFLHSTRLYPEYTFATLGAGDSALARKVAAQLLLYPGGKSAGASTWIGGWTIPESDEDVHALMQSLKLPPYEHFGEVTFPEAVKQHLVESVTALVALTLLTLLVIRLKLAATREKYLLTLEESNAKYRALFEGAGDYLLVLSLPSRDAPPVIVDANTAAFTKHGYSREEMIGKPVFFLDTEAAAAKNRAASRLARERSGPLIFESEHLRKDGTSFPVEVSSTLIRLGGEPLFILSIERDITERKIAEQALMQSEMKFRELLEELPDMVVVHRGGRVLYVNKMVETLSGFSRAELLDTNLLERVAEKDRSLVMTNMVRRAANLSVEDYELDLLHRDGSSRSTIARTNLVLFDKEPAVVVILIDITERKQSEERIEHLNRVLRAIRCVDQLILREKKPADLIDEACRLLVEHRNYSEVAILLFNDQGGHRARAGGDAGREISALGEAELQAVVDCCQDFSRTGGVFQLSQRGELCRDCPLLPLIPDSSICLSLSFESKFYGLLLVTMEAAREIDADEKALLEELAKDLAFALFAIDQGEIKERVQEERDRLESELRHSQKMEAVGRLAGGVAHDFNNMLSVIIGYAELVKASMDSLDPLYNYLVEIEDAAERSVGLTRQLLAFSRKGLTAPAQLNLNDAIGEMRKMLQRMIGEEVTFEFVPGADLWRVWIDPSHVDQILANLAVNARDAIAGQGTIRVKTANVVVGPSGCATPQLAGGDYVQLVFQDTGCGMDAETQQRIFDPFFTTKEEGKGTGLGLSTVYGIISQSEGQVQVASEPGRGTTFSIWLPRFQGVVPEAAVKRRYHAHKGSETILLVEDNPKLLELSGKILQECGYTVLPASTPGDACLISDRHQGEIHLLLTDVVMPVMNGKDLQARVQAQRPGIRTIFMSGYSSEIISHRGVLDYGLNYLDKPFTIKSLAEKVRAVLEADC